MLPRTFAAAAITGCALLWAAPARAHVSVEGPAVAGENQVLVFRIGHGCAGTDTYSLEIQLPAEVTLVRAKPNAFGDPEVVTNDAAIPTGVVWTKDTVKAIDDQFYEFKLRIKVPDAPFSTITFPAIQHCRAEDGTEQTVNWDGTDEPAPVLVILPAHGPGWNKYTVPNAIDDPAAFFGDAQIVWAGNAAFSANPTIAALIEAEPDVDTLTSIPAGTEIWVKY